LSAAHDRRTITHRRSKALHCHQSGVSPLTAKEHGEGSFHVAASSTAEDNPVATPSSPTAAPNDPTVVKITTARHCSFHLREQRSPRYPRRLPLPRRHLMTQPRSRSPPRVIAAFIFATNGAHAIRDACAELLRREPPLRSFPRDSLSRRPSRSRLQKPPTIIPASSYDCRPQQCLTTRPVSVAFSFVRNNGHQPPLPTAKFAATVGWAATGNNDSSAARSRLSHLSMSNDDSRLPTNRRTSETTVVDRAVTFRVCEGTSPQVKRPDPPAEKTKEMYSGDPNNGINSLIRRIHDKHPMEAFREENRIRSKD
ncbi:hypothetical protein B296_00045509, partial [Ensete ventricosum]